MVSAFTKYERALAAYETASETAAAPDDSPAAVQTLADPELVPRLANGVRLIDLDVDYRRVIRVLRKKGRLRRISSKQVTIVTRPSLERSIQRETDLLQLTPMSARILHLCDGKHPVKTIVQTFAESGKAVDGVPADKACLFGLEMLRVQNLLVAVS